MKRDRLSGSSTGLSAIPLSLVCLTLFATVPATAQSEQTGPEVIEEDYHDTSIPVRDMAPIAPLGSSRHVVKPLGRRPGPPIVSPEPDAVTQDLRQGPLVGTTNKLNFDGVADVDGFAPPDTNASVGNTQVVETVNTSVEIFDKSTGASVLGPAEISSVFSGIPGICGAGASGNYTDPVVLYDKAAGRWLVTIAAGSDVNFTTGAECIAVSTSSDATGTYARYAFSFGADNFNDYPKFGVWPDAYYGSYNMFNAMTGFFGPRVCAYNRAAMLAGKAANPICFRGGTGDFSLLPSDLDGSTTPATGEPNFFLELGTSTTLDLFKFHVDFTTPSNSTFTGPTVLTVPSYTEACFGGTCIPQLGTTQRLDSLADRLMFRLAYRKFASHEALVVTHSVKTGAAASGVRWYEIRNPNTAPTVFQAGTIKSGATSLWMASIGMDKKGDIAVGFSESSSSLHPAIAYTGRVPTDALGTMESIDVVHKGTGSQTGGLNRWGDYTSMSIDPSDDCTFWYANEYIPSNGSFNWHTRLNSFKFTGCP
jgi:hypothetical protein